MKLTFIKDGSIEVANYKFSNGVEVTIEKDVNCKSNKKYRIIYDDAVSDYLDYWQMRRQLQIASQLNDFSVTDCLKEPREAVASNKNKLFG